MIRKLYNSFKRILFKAYCPFCNGYWNEWLEHGFDYKILHEVKIIGGGKRNHVCPNCSSTDRLRMIFSFLKHETKIFNSSGKISILHIAPERQLLEIFIKRNNIDYFPCDKYNHGNIVQEADINKLNFDSNKFDFIICNHVLEHIETDEKAMSELFRVMKNNGIAILQIPYSKSIKNSISDSSITDPKLREEKFGQDDHVRIYSKSDYVAKLTKVGFKVNIISPYKKKLAYSPKKLGLNPKEELFIATK